MRSLAARMRRMAAHALLGSLPMVLGGCFFLCTVNEENSNLRYDQEVLDNSMAALLRAGGCALLPFTKMDAPDPRFEVGYFHEGNGTLAVVAGAGWEWYVRAEADGTLRASRQPGNSGFDGASAARFDDGWVLLRCNQGHALLTVLDGTTESRAAFLDIPDCDGVVGQASGGDRVAFAFRRNGTEVQLGLLGPGLVLEEARTTSLTGRIRFVDESAPGSVSLVVEEAGSWTWRELDAQGQVLAEQTTSELGRPQGNGPSVRRGQGGVVVAAAERLHFWKAGAGSSVQQVDTAAPPSLRTKTWTPTAWFGGAFAVDTEPNQEEPSLLVPLEVRSRAAGLEGFVVLRPPASPCRNDALCRNVGESTLAGVIDHEGKPWGIYHVWAWAMLLRDHGDTQQFVHGLYASPLFETGQSGSAMACPGLEEASDGGSGGSGGGGNDSSAGWGGGAPDAGDGSDGSGGEDSSAGAGGAAGAGGQDGAAGGGGAEDAPMGDVWEDGAAGMAGDEDAGDAWWEGGVEDADGTETGPTFGPLPHLEAFEFNTFLVASTHTLEVSGSGFDGTSRVHLFGAVQPTQLTTPATLKVGPFTTPSQHGMYPMVVAGGAGGPYDSNVVYVRVHSFTNQPSLDDYGASAGTAGESLRVYGRFFPASDPLFQLTDTSSVSVPAQPAGVVSWEGTQYQTATVVIPSGWASGPLYADQSSTLLRLFMGRHFSVGQDLSRAPGSVVTASSAGTNAPASRAVDADLSTQWIAATTCGGVCGASGPELRVVLPTPSSVRRIVVRGIRALPPTYNVVRSRLTLEGAASSVLWQDDWVHPQKNLFDLELVLPASVHGVHAVSVRVLEDLGSFPGVAELAILAE